MSIKAVEMKNIAIINAINLSDYAFKKLHDNKSSVDFVKNFATSLSDIEKTVFLLSKSSQAGKGYDTVIKEKWTVFELLNEIKEKSTGYDNIFYFYADCALLDKGITQRMYENHLKYFADYTFADGYPYGLSPEILKTPVIDPLLKLIKEEKAAEPQRDTLFELIKKDINSFDLETEISTVDLRILRATLAADSKRNFLLLSNLASHNAFDEQTVVKVLQEKGEILRTLPRYFLIQTVEGCAQVCSYCPYPKVKGDILGKKAEMKFEDFNLILDKIKDYCEDAVIGISLWGEPSLHSQVYKMIERVCDIPGFDLVIETAGLGWDIEALRSLGKNAYARCRWIVSLDAVSEKMYESLRGQGFREALAFTDNLLKLFKNNVYVQAVRMRQNEDELEKFYKQWKETAAQIIIQKYDYFSGFLPQQKVTDLSPLKRFPCWHLKRDMCVTIDGNVPLCKEDLKGTHSLGNILSDELSVVWNKAKEVYLKHLKEQYPDMCSECDEYYTFNF
ncbi:MAG: spiro-SPASM protein [Spirochaetales bacterium]|nr:spiro-SPASM protein [Spirochaetales bacterium]